MSRTIIEREAKAKTDLESRQPLDTILMRCHGAIHARPSS